MRRTADRPYLGTEGRVEERYAADVRPVSGRGDDMLGMKLHRVGVAGTCYQSHPVASGLRIDDLVA
jgi:hypothetical protein